MDPLKGAGALMLPQGPKGHRVRAKKKKKSNVDPFRSLLIESCYLQQPCPPPKPLFSASACLRLIVDQ